MQEKRVQHHVESFGFILVRFNKRGVLEYLFVCRRTTYAFVDFVLGKYNEKNEGYIKHLIENMTIRERNKILAASYVDLWHEIYLTVRQPIGSFYNSMCEKFSRVILRFRKLDAEIPRRYESPEWGFPKGRLNYNEDVFNCAMRELQEETGIHSSMFVPIRSILPFEERYMGTNGTLYKVLYFIGVVNKDCRYRLDETNYFQMREIGDIQWHDYEGGMKVFREDEKSKRELLQKVHSEIYKTFLKNDDTINASD